MASKCSRAVVIAEASSPAGCRSTATSTPPGGRPPPPVLGSTSGARTPRHPEMCASPYRRQSPPEPPGTQRPGPAGGIASTVASTRILLVDNHDSYSYNLVHLVAGVTGVEPDVVL